MYAAVIGWAVPSRYPPVYLHITIGTVVITATASSYNHQRKGNGTSTPYKGGITGWYAMSD
jgi:hypothetical protein